MPDETTCPENETPSGGYGALLKRLIPLSRPYRRRIFLSILVVAAITLLELALPYVTKTAIDRHIVPTEEARSFSDGHLFPEASGTEENLRGIGRLSLLFLILLLLYFAADFIQEVLMESVGQSMMHDLRLILFRRMQSFPISFYSEQPVGGLVSRVTNDIQNMQQLFSTVVSFLFKDLFLILGIAAVLIHISPSLALLTTITLPVLWFAAAECSVRFKKIFHDTRVKLAEISTRLSETVAGMKIIQLFGEEHRNYVNFKRANRGHYLLEMGELHLGALFLPFVELMGTMTVAATLWYGGGRVLSGGISLGGLVAFLTYIRMLFGPIRDVARKYNILQDSLASASRVFSLLDREAPLPAPATGNAAPFLGLSFENVSFAYRPGEPVLKNISFTLNAGETLGIVGPTGSGKSTIISLIIRFYDPTSGQIRFNGENLGTLPPGACQARTALVMQDPYLFSGTIAENILMGNTACSEAALADILTASNCRHLVDRAPQGIDTVLSEAGASLSSGERQLISIARAFARDPDLIIMDEATSHIDSQTEQEIQEAMFNLMKNRTAIVVAPTGWPRSGSLTGFWW